MTHVRKLTARTLGCEMKAGETFVVIGRVSRSSTGSSQYGEYVQFHGEFQGINEATGGTFTSTRFIGPGVGEDIVYNALKAAQAHDKNAVVEMAIRFEAEERDLAKSPRGYEWVCHPLLELASEDPLARIRAQVDDKLKLPAPEPEAEKPEPEAEKPEPAKAGGKKVAA